MSKACPIQEIEQRIELIVQSHSESFESPLDRYDAYESAAISILDSEFDQHEPYLLECMLSSFLHFKQREIGVAFTLQP